MKTNLFLLFCSLFVLQNAFAGTTARVNALVNQETTKSGGDKTSAATDTKSVYDSATDAQKNNKSGQVISTLIQVGTSTAGMAMMATGCPPPTKPTCYVGIGLMAASQMFGKQAGSFGGSAGIAGTAAGQSYGYDDISAGGGAVNDLNGSGLNDPYVRSVVDVDAYKANVASKIPNTGIDFNNPNGKVTVDGKDYKVSDFQSADAMKKAGMPDSASSAFQSKLDSISAMAQQKAEKALNSKIGSHTAANGYEEGGGAGRSSSSSSSSDSSSGGTSSSAGLGNGLAGKGLGRDPSSVSGLSKDLNGDPIGVASDSIFAMMTRRYKLKEKQNSFIDAALKPQL